MPNVLKQNVHAQQFSHKFVFFLSFTNMKSQFLHTYSPLIGGFFDRVFIVLRINIEIRIIKAKSV
jgi:hypothetical protein